MVGVPGWHYRIRIESGVSMVMPNTEERRLESRNASLMVAKRRLVEALSELDFLIAATATGDRRDTLTDVNIHLLEARKYLDTLSSEAING
jgi:hypothetical protein